MKPELFFQKIKNFIEKEDIAIDDLTFDDIDDYIDPIASSFAPYKFNYGASRGCFTPLTKESYVFKFDFNGLEENYCEHEMKLYKEAQDWEIEYLFASIKLYDNLFCTPLYIQQRVNKIGADCKDGIKITKEDKQKTLKKIAKYKGCTKIPTTWIAAVEKIYGPDIVDTFMLFCETFGINDLHCCNVGYTIDNKPIVFDYAGYYESSSGDYANY